jgi:hypothetical protein
MRGRAGDRGRPRTRAPMPCVLEESFAGQDLDRQVDSDLAFHQAIAEASHNVIVGHLTASLLRLMRDNLRRNLSELMQVPAARGSNCWTSTAPYGAPSSRAMPIRPWRRPPATSAMCGRILPACCAATPA